MNFLAFTIACLAGFVAGYFFTTIVLALITAACVGVGIYMILTFREMERIIAAIFIIYSTIANLVMWITYYAATQQTWIGTLLHGYVIR